MAAARQPTVPTPAAPAPPAGEEEFEEEEGEEYWEEGEEEEGEYEDEEAAEGDEHEYTDEEYDEEGEEEEGEDGSEDDEDHDLLKFEKWRNPALKDQTITAIYVSSRAIVCGTSLGEILLLTADGVSRVSTDAELRTHESPVRDICVDSDCDYVASVCEGGVLFIQNINSRDFYQQQFDRPLLTITLHPRYKYQEDKPFVCGGHEGRVVLSTKGFFFGNRKLTVLEDKCGRVYCTRWCGNNIAWATEHDIVVYNARTKDVLLRMGRLASAPRADLFRCCLLWESETQLVVAWGNLVRVISVTLPRIPVDKGKAQLDYGFETDKRIKYRICGLASFDTQRPGHFVLLTTSALDGVVTNLDVLVVNRANGDIVDARALPVPEGPASLITTFLLAQTYWGADDPITEASLLIATPVMGNIRGRRTDDDDRIKRMLQKERFIEAFNFSKSHQIRSVTGDTLGQYVLNDLFRKQEWAELARWVSEIIGDGPKSGSSWEKWIGLFVENHKSHVLLPYIPSLEAKRRLDGGPAISAMSYELVLHACLMQDVSAFKKSIMRFKGLYDPKVLCNDAETRLRNLKLHKTDKASVADEYTLQQLGECVGLLHEMHGDHGQALVALMDVRESVELFDFIERHKLYAEALNMIEQLFEKSKRQTLQLLTTHAVNPESDLGPLAPLNVMAHLESNPQLAWAYLSQVMAALTDTRSKAYHNAAQQFADGDSEALAASNSKRLEAVIAKFHHYIVTLFIKFEPDKLLGFLQRYSGFGSNDSTYDLCVQHDLIEESVFISAQMGARERPIRTLIEQLKSVPKAVNFIRMHGEKEEDQDEYFRILVDVVLETDKMLEGKQGNKFFEHEVRDGSTEDWEHISKRYSVDLGKLLSFNNTTSDRTPLPRPRVKIPCNMLQDMLTAVAEPGTIPESQRGSGRQLAASGFDPIYLLRHLPSQRHIPNLAENLTRIATSKKSHARLMQTIITVLDGDIHEEHQNLHRAMRRGVRMRPSHELCEVCDEPIALTANHIVTFRCGHVVHARCGLRALCDRGAVRLPNSQQVMAEPGQFTAVADEFYHTRGMTLQPARRYATFPFCTVCTEAAALK